MSLAGGETHGCSRRAAAGLAEAAAAPPGCHTAGSALPPREGAGSPPGAASQAAAAAARPASPGPGGGKRPRTGERSAPRPWLFPVGAKSRVLPSARGCSEEADPTAREEMRPLPAQVVRAAPWQRSLEMQRGAGSRKGAGDLGFQPQKLLLPSCCSHFRLSTTQGLFSNPDPLLTSTLCLQATEDAEFLRAEERFVLETGNKLQGHEYCQHF